MHVFALRDAVVAAKFLLILDSCTKLALSKDSKKLIGRLRARIDSAVAARWLTNDPATAERIDDFLDWVSSSLFDAIPEGFDASLLVSNAKSIGTDVRQHLLSQVASLTTSLPNEQRTDKLDTNSELELAFKASNANQARGELISSFAAVVRNDEWLSTLNYMGLNVALDSTTKLVRELASSRGSSQGKTLVEEHRAKLLSDGVVAKVQAPEQKRPSISDIAVVSVSLDVTKLLQLERVRSLSKDHHDLSPRISDILTTAAMPVTVTLSPNGKRPADVAEAKLDELFKSLDAREAAINAKVESDKQASVAATEEKALEALRALGPLAEVLKKNPQLLHKL